MDTMSLKSGKGYHRTKEINCLEATSREEITSTGDKRNCNLLLRAPLRRWPPQGLAQVSVKVGAMIVVWRLFALGASPDLRCCEEVAAPKSSSSVWSSKAAIGKAFANLLKGHPPGPDQKVWIILCINRPFPSCPESPHG